MSWRSIKRVLGRIGIYTAIVCLIILIMNAGDNGDKGLFVHAAAILIALALLRMTLFSSGDGSHYDDDFTDDFGG